MSKELKVEKLSFKDILKDINFNLEEGTINALIGKNTNDKTLLLKSLFGLVNYQGIIRINDNITKQNDLKKEFGLYIGTNNLENKTVFSKIVEPLINLDYDQDKAKKKVYEITKKLDI